MSSENNLFATKLVFCRRNAIVRLPRTRSAAHYTHRNGKTHAGFL